MKTTDTTNFPASSACEHAQIERLTAENRALRERVAVQRDTIRRLRQIAEPAVVARIDEALAPEDAGPCACLAHAAPGAVPVRGRWTAWVRTPPRRPL